MATQVQDNRLLSHHKQRVFAIWAVGFFTAFVLGHLLARFG